jgi:hypothetical protein
MQHLCNLSRIADSDEEMLQWFIHVHADFFVNVRITTVISSVVARNT